MLGVTRSNRVRHPTAAIVAGDEVDVAFEQHLVEVAGLPRPDVWLGEPDAVDVDLPRVDPDPFARQADDALDVEHVLAAEPDGDDVTAGGPRRGRIGQAVDEVELPGLGRSEAC